MTTVTITDAWQKALQSLNAPSTYSYTWDANPYLYITDEDGKLESQRKYKQRLNDFLKQCSNISF